MGSVRLRRRFAGDPTRTERTSPRAAAPSSVASRVGAGDRLDLGARIALAGDLQRTVGNAAATQLLGFARTDRRSEPPNGAREIVDAAGGGGTRGLTRTTYVANPPIFRVGRVENNDGTWSTRPNDIRLPSLDHEVFYPAPGRHRLGDYGSASHYLDVTDDWSARILQGEEEHVDDTDRAWQMTWGRVAGIVNDMAAGEPFTGPTVDAARTAAWEAFKRRLPAALRPEGAAPTTDAQEAKWGAENQGTIFRQLMRETRRARDYSGWHTPDEGLKAMEGDDRVDELSVGNSRIGATPSERLIQEAWARLTSG